MGGMFGLFIGLSSLGLVHICEFLIKLCWTVRRTHRENIGTTSPFVEIDEKPGTSKNNISTCIRRIGNINNVLERREDIEMTPVST